MTFGEDLTLIKVWHLALYQHCQPWTNCHSIRVSDVCQPWTNVHRLWIIVRCWTTSTYFSLNSELGWVGMQYQFKILNETMKIVTFWWRYFQMIFIIWIIDTTLNSKIQYPLGIIHNGLHIQILDIQAWIFYPEYNILSFWNMHGLYRIRFYFQRTWTWE